MKVQQKQVIHIHLIQLFANFPTFSVQPPSPSNKINEWRWNVVSGASHYSA